MNAGAADPWMTFSGEAVARIEQTEADEMEDDGASWGARLDALRFQEENTGKEVFRRETDLLVSLEEMEKMDALLKMKFAEEKRAKLSTIRAAEESRDVLSKLPRSKISDRMETNLEDFMKLLSEVVKTETDPLTHFGPNEADGAERGDAEEDKGRETDRPRQNAAGLNFVERNIQLAKCGRGTLSLTDEEKSRIETLLVDVEEVGPKASEDSEVARSDAENRKESYAVDDRTRSILSEIDQRLEVLTKLKSPEAELKIESGESSLEESGENLSRKRKKGKGKARRLEEIDKLLDSMNSVSEEEIRPLPEEEIESLVRGWRRSPGDEDAASEGGAAERANSKPPREVITELVSGAKSQMPKFKYRFDEN